VLFRVAVDVTVEDDASHLELVTVPEVIEEVRAIVFAAAAIDDPTTRF